MRFSVVAFLAITVLSVTAAPTQSSKAKASGKTSIDGIVYIHPTSDSKKCLAAGDSKRGSPVIIGDCPVVPDPSYIWEAFSSGGGSKLRVFDQCLDLPSGNTKNGQRLQLYDCKDGNLNQQWSLREDKRTRKFVASVKGKNGKSRCMDLTDGITKNKSQIQSWECFKGNTNQQWTAERVW